MADCTSVIDAFRKHFCAGLVNLVGSGFILHKFIRK